MVRLKKTKTKQFYFILHEYFNPARACQIKSNCKVHCTKILFKINYVPLNLKKVSWFPQKPVFKINNNNNNCFLISKSAY